MESKKKKPSSSLSSSKTFPSLISKLPDDCLIYIFSLLPIADRIRIRRVCNRWYHLSSLSWNSCKTLTLDLKDWGFGYRSRTRINRVMLRDVLNLCGNYVTCIDFSRYMSEWDSRKSINGSKNLFEEFKKLCPNLTILRISNIKVTLKGIEYLAKTQSNLREIEMTYYYDNCDEAISFLFRKNRNLRCLNLFIPDLSSKCWLDLNPLAIEEIYLRSCMKDANSFRIALERFANLRIFAIEDYLDDITFMSHIDEFLKAISSHGEKLEKLSVDCFHDPVYLCSIHFQNFQNLQEFILCGTHIKMDDKFFKVLANYCRKITTLKLKYLGAADLEIRHIVELPELRVLHLSELNEVTDAVFLNSLPCLAELYCCQCPQIKNVGLCELLHESANLKILKIKGCKNINMEVLVQDAKEATDKRIDGPVLKMEIPGIRSSWRDETKKINLSKFFELTEYLS